jgi:hypothetical protein
MSKVATIGPPIGRVNNLVSPEMELIRIISRYPDCTKFLLRFYIGNRPKDKLNTIKNLLNEHKISRAFNYMYEIIPNKDTNIVEIYRSPEDSGEINKNNH